jgi:sec-independent protein translocase protein TatC
MSGEQESFISHLVELRSRLVRAVGAMLAVFVVLVLWPGSGAIYDFLAVPLMSALPPDAKMIAIGVITPFMVPIKVTALAAFCVALPYVLYQAWAFVAPGLYEHEKRLALPLIVASTLLFLAGMAFCYYIVFEQVFTVIHAWAPKSITPAPDIESYFSFVLTMFLAFAHGPRDRGEAARRAALRDRWRLRHRRDRHSARRAVAVHAGGADVPALRGGNLPRALRRGSPQGRVRI